MSKKIILIIIIIGLVIFSLFQIFLKKEDLGYSLVRVSRGDVAETISETGQVIMGEKINLGFKTAGRVKRIYVEVGQEVKTGEILAKLETADLSFQLQEAKAALSISQAKLDKLLAGASPEEVKVAETEVSNAEISLDAAIQSLEDIKAQAKENLDADYEDALNTLEDSYLKAYSAQITADLIQRTYFTNSDQEGIDVRENKEKIKAEVSLIKSYLDTAQADPKKENIDLSSSQIKDGLSAVSNSLKIIREICEDSDYRNTVSSANKTSLDTRRTNINTALTNITNSQQSISSTKLTNEYNINTAQAEVSSVEGQLQAAEDNLALVTAPPQKSDTDLYQAQVDQARAKVQLLENQIQEATLKSPTNGKITEIKKRVGEMAQPALQDIVISLLPLDPFEIEVDVYEEDVVKINIGNPADISLVAFPDQVFKGKVISINPAQKLIEGVVYYKVTISFEEIPDMVKPGMTADVVIKTAIKENVLIIPEDAIQIRDGKTIVQVLKAGVIQDREIEIGLKGSDDMTEVISGLEEGEEIVIK